MKSSNNNSVKNLALFFALALSITWIIGFLPIILGIENTLTGTIIFLLGAASPSILGVVFVLRTYSKKETKNYFIRCFSINRAVLKSMLLTLLYFIVLSLIMLGVGLYFFKMEMPGFVMLKTIIQKPYFVFFWLLNCYISGSINEEYGWRGYALDNLLMWFGFLKSSLLLGFIWAIWHLPWFFMPGQAQYIGVRSSNPVLYVSTFLLSTMGLSCLITFAYIKTNRKVVACIFIHMMSNGIMFGLLLPFATDEMYTLAHFVAIIGALIVTIYAVFSKKLKKQTEKVSAEIKEEKLLGIQPELPAKT